MNYPYQNTEHDASISSVFDADIEGTVTIEVACGSACSIDLTMWAEDALRFAQEVIANARHAEPELIGTLLAGETTDDGEELNDMSRFAEAVAKVTPCNCSAQRQRADRAEAEVERLKSLLKKANNRAAAARAYAAAAKKAEQLSKRRKETS